MFDVSYYSHFSLLIIFIFKFFKPFVNYYKYLLVHIYYKIKLYFNKTFRV